MEDEQQQPAAGKEAAASGAARPAASRITDDIRERMSSLRPEAADGVQHAADVARRAADSIHGEDEWMAQLVEQGAAKLTDLADTLRTNDLQSLLAKTQEFARRQPVLFAGAAMALGFTLTRAATAAMRAPRQSPSQERSDADD